MGGATGLTKDGDEATIPRNPKSVQMHDIAMLCSESLISRVAMASTTTCSMQIEGYDEQDI